MTVLKVLDGGECSGCSVSWPGLSPPSLTNDGSGPSSCCILCYRSLPPPLYWTDLLHGIFYLGVYSSSAFWQPPARPPGSTCPLDISQLEERWHVSWHSYQLQLKCQELSPSQPPTNIIQHDGDQIWTNFRKLSLTRTGGQEFWKTAPPLVGWHNNRVKL